LVTLVEGITAGTYPQRYRETLHHSRRTLAHRRLTEVFVAAKRVPFDDASRIVFFSDCHRGDNSRADGFARNEALFLHALNHYYREGFTYVEVGDGDELWKNRRFSAIRRAHGRVFDLLHRFDQKRRLHLIVGNHDIQGSQHHRVEKDGLIAHEGLVLHHATTGQRVFVVHGHQVDFKSDRLYAIGRFAARHMWKRLQLLGLGSRIRHSITEWLQANRQIVICGHTHHPTCAGYGAPPYFNTGSCVYSGFITGLEIRGGEITLVRWSTEPGTGPRGAQPIERQLLAPPRKLRLFN
jgi:UDP-2,3-diacylglucosamine pyrophosphatase LpxH